MSAIILEGNIVHYEVIGRGRPVIFLHGWLGSWRYWVPAMQTASTNFRAYSLDMWGFGDSARETQRYTIQEQITLLERFLGEMGIGKVALVGHGLGALVSLLYSLRAPATVDRMMLIGCPLDATAVNTRLKTANLTELTEWLLTKTPAAEPARVDGLKADQQAVLAAYADMNNLGFSVRLDRITPPTLLVRGQNDPLVVQPELDANAPQNVHQMDFEQSGHFPMLDEQAQFNRLLTDWLALESGESPRDLQLKEEWRRRVR